MDNIINDFIPRTPSLRSVKSFDSVGSASSRKSTKKILKKIKRNNSFDVFKPMTYDVFHNAISRSNNIPSYPGYSMNLFDNDNIENITVIQDLKGYIEYWRYFWYDDDILYTTGDNWSLEDLWGEFSNIKDGQKYNYKGKIYKAEVVEPLHINFIYIDKIDMINSFEKLN